MKNSPTVEQIALACRHVDELMKAGVTENLAIRTLELFTDVYAALLIYKRTGPHHVSKVPEAHWSIKARALREAQSAAKSNGNLIVEHGTPRRGLARKVLELAQKSCLTSENLDGVIRRYYRLAVITVAENEHLNSISRSGMLETPETRWEQAGIKF